MKKLIAILGMILILGLTISAWPSAFMGPGIAEIVNDTTPQLGGPLDFNNKVLFDDWTAFVNADATPNVSAGSFFKTANAGATTISDFDDTDDHGDFQDGRLLFVWVNDANTTFDFTSSELEWASQGANDYVSSQDDFFIFQFDSSADAGGAGWRVIAGPMPSHVALSTLKLPQGTDPDLTVVGQISHDTDGGNETGDESDRGHDGTNQYVRSRKLKDYHFLITDPENIVTWAGRANPSQPVWENQSGFSFIIVKVKATSDEDNYDFTLFESNSETDLSDENDTSIVAIECDANGTECFTDEEVLTHVVEHGHHIIFEHTLGTAGGVKVTITGWYNADVD